MKNKKSILMIEAISGIEKYFTPGIILGKKFRKKKIAITNLELFETIRVKKSVL